MRALRHAWRMAREGAAAETLGAPPSAPLVTHRDLARAKSGMLAGAVAANLAEIEGRRPRGLVRNRWPRRLAAAGVLLGLSASSYLLATVRGRPPAADVAARAATPEPAAAGSAPATARAGLDAPVPAPARSLPRGADPASAALAVAAPAAIDPSVFPVAIRRIL